MSKEPVSTRHIAQDGYRPASSHIDRPNKVQGGYQAPAGGSRPAAPTTGSGVKTPSSPPPKK